MILLKNESTGFVIKLDDSSDRGFQVNATEELTNELADDESMLSEMIEHRTRVIEHYRERAEDAPDMPTIEQQIADRLLTEGYEIVAQTEVDNTDDDEGEAIVF